MNQTILFEWFIDVVGAALIFSVYAFLRKQQRVDHLREQLFSLRDELFDVAAAGEVSFNDASYTQLRLLINGTIRFAHKVTFMSLFLSSVVKRIKKPSAFEQWKDSLETLQPQARKKIESIHSRVFAAYTAHIVGGSFILMCLAVFIGSLLATRALYRHANGRHGKRSIKDMFNQLTGRAARKVVDVTNSRPEQLEGVFIAEGQRANQQSRHAYV